MSPTFVMTSAWWLDASPQACWPLIADARRWPAWWRSMSVVGALPRHADGQGGAGIWRAVLGLPLRLRTRHRASEPCQLIEWQIHGDINANLTWVLASAPPGGCDVTCRWEIEPMRRGPAWVRTLARLLLERSHFARMRACASDMGVELGCSTARLQEWSGRTHR
jgi:hypothetical protein